MVNPQKVRYNTFFFYLLLILYSTIHSRTPWHKTNFKKYAVNPPPPLHGERGGGLRVEHGLIYLFLFRDPYTSWLWAGRKRPPVPRNPVAANPPPPPHIVPPPQISKSAKNLHSAPLKDKQQQKKHCAPDNLAALRAGFFANSHRKGGTGTVLFLKWSI
jgi:hypothetical protein